MTKSERVLWVPALERHCRGPAVRCFDVHGRRAANDAAQAVAGLRRAPISVAPDTRGNACVLSTDLNFVCELHPTGVLTRVAGNGSSGDSGDPGTATRARLLLHSGQFSTNSAGVAVGNPGNLFIGDATNHRIRRVFLNRVITSPSMRCRSPGPAG
jgi:hypothetical protein